MIRRLTRVVALSQLSMRVDTFCAATCKLGPLTEDVAKQFRSKIEDEYRVNLCVVSHAY